MADVWIVMPPGYSNGVKGPNGGVVFFHSKPEAREYLKDAFKKEIKAANAASIDWKNVYIEKITDADLL